MGTKAFAISFNPASGVPEKRKDCIVVSEKINKDLKEQTLEDWNFG